MTISRVCASMTIFTLWLIFAGAAARSARAQTFTVLHRFQGNDGDASDGVVVRDASGNLYGTTVYGGAGKCAPDCGTAFEVNKDGTGVWLHSFNGRNGRLPAAGLLRDSAGNLFGTTLYGGVSTCNSGSGCGTVFKLDKTGKKETVLHRFTGSPDGSAPTALLVEDAAGNLYGTTEGGGVYSYGAVFKIDKMGRETVLYSFTNGTDGCSPGPGVILDSRGNLYGVAQGGVPGYQQCGVAGYGVVFKVDTAGNDTVLYTFDEVGGSRPDSVLVFDSHGNLYGTTETGGACEYSCGVVFELSPQSSGQWLETVLYNFCSLSDCADGEEPGTGPLVVDKAGNLYGTTFYGGVAQDCHNNGCGVVFKLDTSGKETVLYRFTGGKDGAQPLAGLAIDSAGSLYGATTSGGDLSCKIGNGNGCGVVFKITP